VSGRIYSGVEYREYSPEKTRKKYGKNQTENLGKRHDNPFRNIVRLKQGCYPRIFFDL
jgi:hypothetical protein